MDRTNLLGYALQVGCCNVSNVTRKEEVGHSFCLCGIENRFGQWWEWAELQAGW